MSSAKGPLKKAGGSQSRQSYDCIVPSCDKELRSDELKGHYLNKVDFDLLSTVKTFTKTHAILKINELTDPIKKSHTLFFYESGFLTQDDIPSYKSQKRPSSAPKTPWEQIAEKRQKNPGKERGGRGGGKRRRRTWTN